ncbi:uncharacterized protein L969DRAFT_97050 [Mixia osmundae IAM 14324]|uniref:Kinase n=1 Tax=Mixia osmundae (strain CBS 9802 / IAM 14324 / JCM 22182 / KY 12970) TaxID=764103 RepID=G7E1I5_MIXOS|nr:uncharacterized protein L969DRAFT_97050 [Mixia osmundae IAM 14324]KEI36648.1 hypothetical protein L969DRAFT_97050 [Mixia osmundae IAM 14324]GAA96695.1 hypothetical protein E5Q_03366 [Mixia osmundae IAM 14324]
MNAAAPTDWHTIKVVVPFLTEEQAELARTILSIDQEIKPYMIKRTLTAAGTSLQASFEALSIRQARVPSTSSAHRLVSEMQKSPTSFSDDAAAGSDSPFTPFEHQVAGHRDTLFLVDQGRTLLKRSSAREIQFYTGDGPRLSARLMADCLPRLRNIKPAWLAHLPPHPHWLAVENVLAPFERPNVIDVKLGQQLFDEDAPPDKQARMLQASLTTTSSSMGLRITGFKVWDEARQAYALTDKQYGKHITATELPTAMQRFFPCAEECLPTTEAEKSHSPAGMAARSLEYILTTLISRLRQFARLTGQLEWRARASSVLIAYESCGTAWRQQLPHRPIETLAETGQPHLPCCDVRLIDFAHTRATPGAGKDVGFELGLSTLIRLLEDRLADVQML